MQGLRCGGAKGMMFITSSDRFAIFGARGMAGSAICSALDRMGYTQQLKPSRAELDLLDPRAVQQWFSEQNLRLLSLLQRRLEAYTQITSTCLIFCWRPSRFRHM